MKFNVTSTIISVIELPCSTEVEALALIRAGSVDLIQDAEAIRNVTLDNGLEQDDVEASEPEENASKTKLDS